MAAIRGKDTKPELIVRRGLHARGLRYRLHCKNLPGKPDLVFPSRRIVLFVNGCFWHAHEGCKYFKIPRTDREKWKSKLVGNRARDQRNQEQLTASGWRVLIVWECAVKQKSAAELTRFLDTLASEVRSAESCQHARYRSL